MTLIRCEFLKCGAIGITSAMMKNTLLIMALILSPIVSLAADKLAVPVL